MDGPFLALGLPNHLKIGFGRVSGFTLEGSGRLWGLSWALLGSNLAPDGFKMAPGASFGCFWGQRGFILVHLGCSWALLGRSWAPLCRFGAQNELPNSKKYTLQNKSGMFSPKKLPKLGKSPTFLFD